MNRLISFPKLPRSYEVPFNETSASYWISMNRLLAPLRERQFRDIRANMYLDIERQQNRYYETN